MQYDGVPVVEVDAITKSEGEATSIWIVGWGPPLPRTRWGRFWLRAKVVWARRHDAMAVLRGDAEAVRWEDM